MYETLLNGSKTWAGFEVVTNTRVLTSFETSALWTAAGSLLILLNSLLRVVEK